ncbi:pyridoxal phosphate-dependent aminotransferase [Desulforamulus hydrothermalis]|uniref:Putative aspartate aminotransferase YhdR n=1 Tax=Desulforamulus hydrothermalis Lam5 = DSM 18033 TaxID=1121428 RepID=K8EBI2_9FIRM|nr:pyridoxal phosphate-dependent aminotransferase [Desulforamulus hydrothermalis]CCO09013.1 putative aspartate aminotransferase YhdR [Desulforamulus hydrothermalis Lam5 = DSM 18033]SHG76930.1 aspartate aminotransferase [Desulforamulus hydrothermalis Lam5 = DSM 18033]
MVLSDKVASFLNRASWIRKMFEEGDRLRKIHGADQVFDFTLGNPSVEPPPQFREELKKLALHPEPGMHRYMSNAGYPETRSAVAEVLAEQSGLPFAARHIVMTVGAGGGLNVVFKAILNPGEEVIAISPYFVEYGFYVDNHGGVLKVVPAGADFLPDLPALRAAITDKTRAVIINSPNNPTGVVYPAAVLAQLGQLVEEKSRETGREIFVISDEPYAKIVYDGVQVPSVFKYITNAVMVTSHSKDLALPGERIGYIAVSPRIEGADTLVEGLVFCNRTLGFVNAPALMQRLVTGLQRVSVDVAEYQAKRDLLYHHLTSLGFQMVQPQGAFYLFPKSPLPDDIEFCRQALKHNILVVPGGGFGAPGYFRLAYCIDMEIIKRSLPAWTALARELGMPS